MFDYKLIEALAAVIEKEGFDRAARWLNITQSAVSQRVKLLEEQTGQVLLVRTTPPRPTPAGQNLIKHCLQVKQLENELLGEIDRQAKKGYSSIALALNADSLATWFMEVMHSFVEEEKILLDIRVDDQEQTHRMLKNGNVVGCISTRESPLQGCRIDYIGCMRYQMLGSPKFALQWFPQGITPSAVAQAPAIVYNRKDNLQNKLLGQVLNETVEPARLHYIPSAEKFADSLVLGIGYGMLPLQQSRVFLQSGQLIDLAPGHSVEVKLYWHRWNIQSSLLNKLTHHLTVEAGKVLKEMQALS